MMNAMLLKAFYAKLYLAQIFARKFKIKKSSLIYSNKISFFISKDANQTRLLYGTVRNAHVLQVGVQMETHAILFRRKMLISLPLKLTAGL
jgi:hypothetical protein